jgi:hypothetical protein
MASSPIPRRDTMTKFNDRLGFDDPAMLDRESHDRMPTYITCGPMLCELRIWTEAEWLESGRLERPIAFARVRGLGWIGAVPVECMN